MHEGAYVTRPPASMLKRNIMLHRRDGVPRRSKDEEGFLCCFPALALLANVMLSRLNSYYPQLAVPFELAPW